MSWGGTLVRVAVDVVADGLSVNPKNKLSLIPYIRHPIDCHIRYIFVCHPLPSLLCSLEKNAANYKPIKIAIWTLIRLYVGCLRL
jgi:hypothetical protein